MSEKNKNAEQNTCIFADGTVRDHHADHPDYIFSVDVRFVGHVSELMKHAFHLETGTPIDEFNDNDVRNYHSSRHALIYVDDRIALTMHEFDYYIFSLKNAFCAGSNRHDFSFLMLSQESFDRIKKYKKGQT